MHKMLGTSPLPITATVIVMASTIRSLFITNGRQDTGSDTKDVDLFKFLFDCSIIQCVARIIGRVDIAIKTIKFPQKGRKR